jgi:hypothetical protein
LYVSGEVYAGGRWASKYYSNVAIDRFINGKVTNITVDSQWFALNEWSNGGWENKINYLNNGLFIVENNNNTLIHIVYNEYFNENILADFKLNENTTIISLYKDSYNIRYEPNQIIIHDSASVAPRIFWNRIIMKFDEYTKRLISLSKESFDNGHLNYNFSFYYEYTYDHLGRLEYVYRNYNDQKILIKSIYYDGVYRTIPRPFLYSLETFSQREIIIYDNDRIKYYIQTLDPKYDRTVKEILEEEDAAYSLLTFEYDYNGNEIVQTIFREQSEYYNDESITTYIIENLEYDDRNNWVKQNVYYALNNSSPSLIEIFSRSINYE